ncbi:hypothetical protein OLMES_5019 [Oleiphilus messinensis]|uniref:Uncharacterized protein n=1 Tax=Oleiphilus messinensis TaxID=141451 RepID=A0A1Y0IGP7_9GAMM|nr:hypothetical protein [Oleiphilus messinensis]ARU59006.1 hypothetical protein OLMES_5019 [Oleiphilus messinensis]
MKTIISNMSTFQAHVVKYCTSVAFAAVFVGLTGAPLQAEPIAPEQFHQCALYEYEVDNITPDTAFLIAECFARLLPPASGSDELDTTEISPLIIRQYADSWYNYASVSGHRRATEQLGQIREGY